MTLFNHHLSNILCSYEFHDKYRASTDSLVCTYLFVCSQVRVPLHIAVMAAQNMEASLTVSPAHKVEFDALTGSLTVMSKGPFIHVLSSVAPTHSSQCSTMSWICLSSVSCSLCFSYLHVYSNRMDTGEFESASTVNPISSPFAVFLSTKQPI